MEGISDSLRNKLQLTRLYWRGIELHGSQLSSHSLLASRIVKALGTLRFEPIAADSPFLLLTLRQVIESLHFAKPVSAKALTGLAASLIDFAWRTRQDCVELPIEISVDTIIPFILCGFEWQASPSHVSFESRSDRLHWLSDKDEPCTTSLPGHELTKLTRFSHAQSVVMKRPCHFLFDKITCDAISRDQDSDCTLAASVSAGLNLIQSYDARRAARILQGIQVYVPICSVKSDTHASFTNHSLPGAMFLSVSDDNTVIAEALVHEFGHYELSLASQFSPLVNDEDRANLYYSPWRTDARPLDGLLHAIYVFSEVLRFFDTILVDPDLLVLNKQRIDWRVKIQALRLQIALKEIAGVPLTDLARRIAEYALNSLAMVQARLKNIPQAVLYEITTHQLSWENAHPELRRRA